MENTSQNKLVRKLGLKESISMTIGTVVGVGLFTCGSSQVGKVGPWIILLTLLALLISIWPCMLYGEMSAALPCAGGTYNYAKRGLNRVFANLSGWHYIVSVIAIGAGETLAFSNYFTILLNEFGLDISWLDSRCIAIALVLIFLVLNFFGIELSGKLQTGFVFFFWACSIAWFCYMIPHVHLEYFGEFKFSSLPSFRELMYIFGLVWWCYTGFETCVSMGGEVKNPTKTLPRALIISVFLVFAVNAIFQWFLVGLVPNSLYDFVANANAPYAESLKAIGLTGFPIILLCIGIAFGGDLSTINPGIAAPARYIFSMAEDGALPKIFAKVHPKFKTPWVALILVGIINVILIATGSIDYIASVSLISLGLCYIIGCLAYIGLKKKYPNLKRPYKAPFGTFGAIFTIIVYLFMLAFSDWKALVTSGAICVVCVIYWLIFVRKKKCELPTIEEEIGKIDELTIEDQKKEDKKYLIWKIVTIVVTIIAVGIYIIPMIINSIK